MGRIVPIPVDFDVVGWEPELPVGHSQTITGVHRDGRGIGITYEIQPPLSLAGIRTSRRGTITTRNAAVSAGASAGKDF